MADEQSLREKFTAELDEVCWRDLRAHLARDVLIWVAEALELTEVGVQVALDDKAQIARWIDAGQLRKPDRAQLDSWEARLDKPFRVLIAQPFILIQEVAAGD